MNAPKPTTHDDGLEWLRDVRRRMLDDAQGSMKSLGDHYRKVQQQHPERIFDPRKAVAEAARRFGRS